MPLYNVHAINIRSAPFGEADKLITIFSREQGKLQAIAKGSRRTSSKFGGRLEIFTYNQMLLASGKNLDIVSQCETIESFYRIRENPDKLNSGVYVLKLIDLITEERQKNAELFDLLLDTIHAIHTLDNMSTLCRAFEVKLCAVEGFIPSDDMLKTKFIRLPQIIEKLRSSYSDIYEQISVKDLEISGRIFKELISDHVDVDIRRIKSIL